MKMILIGMLVFAASSASAAPKIPLSGTKVTVKDVISVEGLWLKEKGDKYDIHLAVTNESGKGMIVMLHDMLCYRGKTRGTLKNHLPFNIGEKTIDFQPWERKTLTYKCDLGTTALGDYQVIVKRVFANKSNDGKTKDDIVAKDVTWTSAKSDR